jgi:sulfide:quinone oxidoreductase
VGVLGGGFGGIVIATQLKERLGSGHSITLIDKRPSFFMGLAKLWVLTGARRPDEQRNLKVLELKGIEVIQTEVTKIVPSTMEVITNEGTFSFDYLVVALGAEMAPEAVPGFGQGACNLYDIEGARRTHEAIRDFAGGKLVFMVCGLPFKCPPAPYEAVFLIDEMLRKQGVRGKTDLLMFTPEPFPLPVGGPDAGASVKNLLARKEIAYNPGKKPKQVNSTTKTIEFEDGAQAQYDLLVGVPIHSVPKVVKESGLGGPSGWIPVNKRTLETGFPNVYALGDVAAVTTTNNLLVPKSGILAEEEAKVVANNIAVKILGKGEPREFEGKGVCFLEVGGGQAALVEGEFFAEPVPRVRVTEPSAEGLRAKQDFEASRLAKWFS